jgi:hypothetical protein
MHDDSTSANSPQSRERNSTFGGAIGLNDNVQFMGKQLHVQTEAIRFPSPSIVTQVFSNGRIIYSKKSECAVDSMNIQGQMNKQHAQVLQSLSEKKAQIMGGSQSE